MIVSRGVLGRYTNILQDNGRTHTSPAASVRDPSEGTVLRHSQKAIPLTEIHNAFHVQLLKPYKDPNHLYSGRLLSPPTPIIVNGEHEYDIDSVHAHRRRCHGHIEFLIRWKGYDP
ncbi:hypothetical protein CLOM_g10131 [Closterium sp. NIES-68]|nr:hypothetical protein CLOM_g10131 [Closterium sp. NIES-68]